MRVVYLAAGAAGMVCGSCLRDNRVVATLRAAGRDITLIPLYTPIRTDEQDVSERHVYYGGVNVYLEQKSALLRRVPRALRRPLDNPALLRAVGRFAARTRAEELGAMTVSVLRGEHGHQRVELERLIAALAARRPQLVNLPNLMFLGMAAPLRRALGAAVVCTLSGEDIFLDGLPEPHRGEALRLVREQAGQVDAFVSVTRYFADHAARHFGLPHERIHHVPMGVAAADMDGSPAPGGAGMLPAPRGPFVIAYLARICPEKGLMNLARAFATLRSQGRDCRLRAAGWLGSADRPYFEQVRRFLAESGVIGDFEYLGEVSRTQKFELLRSASAFSVPTDYHEAKGLYILEALAAGTPVVQPRHGSFPELIEETGGGLLYDPADPQALAAALARLMDDRPLRDELARHGHAAVRERFHDGVMAERTWRLYEAILHARSANT